MTTYTEHHIPWYLWPLAVIWRLLAIIVGILLMLVGVIVFLINIAICLSTLSIWDIGGISLANVGLDLLLKGFFGFTRRGDPLNESKIP